MKDAVFEFPALYKAADNASRRTQRLFWLLIKSEYILLLVVAIISSLRNKFQVSPLLITLLLIVLMILFLIKFFKRLDQDWYQSRALAESVKTSTWRFVMRAHPFENASIVEIPKKKFTSLLKEILKVNKHLGESLENSTEEQVTASMMEVRKFTLEERVSYYVKFRIDEQRKWYSRKSLENKKQLIQWLAIVMGIYLCSILMINHNNLNIRFISYGFDPSLVILTSIIGWIQMKRYSELAASYNLTSHEIGIISSSSENVETEEHFSDFVNEAELAFSREHTQWVARRDSN